MTKDQFLKQLNWALKKLPEKERINILQGYEEHFTFAQREGKMEIEMIENLGSPIQIGKGLLADYYVKEATNDKTIGNILRAIWAINGLGFFHLIIALGPILALGTFIISGWILGLLLLFAPILSVLEIIDPVARFTWAEFLFSFVLSGIGYFIVNGMLFVTKLAVNGLIRYLKYNVSVVRGGFTI